MDSPTRLFLIRHGEVEARYHRVFGGRIDMELSPEGHEQAGAIARYLDRFSFDAVYASPMRRARQTLTGLVERQKKSPIILGGLREVDFGVWTGLSWEEVNGTFQVSAFRWLDQLEDGLILEAEPIGQFAERVRRATEIILEDCPGKSVAVVCHGGVIRMMLSQLLDLPLRKMGGIDIEYASLSIVQYRPGKVELELLNLTPWRDLR